MILLPDFGNNGNEVEVEVAFGKAIYSFVGKVRVSKTQLRPDGFVGHGQCIEHLDCPGKFKFTLTAESMLWQRQRDHSLPDDKAKRQENALRVCHLRPLEARTTKYYSVLQSTTPVLLQSVLQSTTPYYKVLLCTTKHYSSTTPYYKVLRLRYSSTTPYYEVLLQYYPSTTPYYKVPLQNYSALHYSSTTPCYSSTTPYYKVLRFPNPSFRIRHSKYPNPSFQILGPGSFRIRVSESARDLS